MSERLGLGSIEFDKKKTGSLREIGAKALDIATDRYCSGYPGYAGGKVKKLGYNNALHGRMVGEDGGKVVSRLGLPSSLVRLAEATGNAHDVVQDNILRGVRGVDEAESAAWMEERLVKAGFEDVVVKLGGKAILGTEPRFDGGGPVHGKIIGQKADVFTYNSREEEKFVKGIASADLGRIYTPIGPFLSHMLYQQRQGKSVSQTPDMDDFLDFQSNQVGFVQNYRYPLREAEGVLATHRRLVTKYTDFVYKQAQDGGIESWKQLVEQDLAFMRNPNMKLA